jgi:hypothetical protein
MDTRTKFLIPEANYPKFEAQIAKLSRKSMKLIGEEIMPVVFGYEYKPFSEGSKETYKVFNVLLTASTPVLDGWEFVARLDHTNETGTIVRTVPTYHGEIPTKYRESVVKCDHCNVQRYRRDTFVLRNEQGEFQQVGSTCLKDFFGHDPYKIAKLAELLGYVNECARAAQEWGEFTPANRRWVELVPFLACAAQEVRKNGWVSRTVAKEKDINATADYAITDYLGGGRYPEQVPTQADFDLAEQALEWAQSLSAKEYLNDYENNLLVIANAEWIEFRSCGLAASIVGVFFMNQERAKKAAAGPSKHVGTLGERVTVEAVVTGNSSRENNFGGITYNYRFLSGDDVVVWFASVNSNLSIGDKVKLTGTVKKLDNFNGKNQTILTRCKVA